MTRNLPPMSETKKTDADYPSLLNEIGAPPSPLYFLGSLPSPSDVTIAIVGTRKATREGLLLAKQIANDLAKAGAVVVSGLALGIDGAAHEGAVLARGRTLAVLGSGLDSIYPRAHENLARSILENDGAIVSEYPAETPPFPSQFLERNRLISGLSLATVVIEAPIHSGALATARFALEQGREVLVAPGPASHPNYKGSHVILRNGARLVTNAAEILEDLKSAIMNHGLTLASIQKTISPKIETKNEADSLIISAFKNTAQPLTVDNLAETTMLESQVVNQRLTFLILNGTVEEKGGRFKLKP